MIIQINMTQATQIANLIWDDIADYIAAHREEFERFLAEQGDEKGV